MRILFTNDPPLIKYGIAEGFRQLQHQVKIMQGDLERLWGQPITEQKNRLQRAIRIFKPDLIFTEGHPGFDPKTVCEIIASFKIPHFYWAIEDPVCTDITLKTFAPYVDFIFTTTVEKVPLYQSLGKRAELLLFGCNPLFHRFTGMHERYQYDLVLVASNYSSRYDVSKWFIWPLIEKGYHIKIWGIWWDDPERPVNLLQYPAVYGGLLPYEELTNVYSSAKIILGVNCDDSSETQTSMRPYEALACGGGVYLGHFTKAQANLFGEFIYQTRNTEETLATVEMILELPDSKRREIAEHAQQLVYQKHTYCKRAEQILKVFDNF